MKNFIISIIVIVFNLNTIAQEINSNIALSIPYKKNITEIFFHDKYKILLINNNEILLYNESNILSDADTLLNIQQITFQNDSVFVANSFSYNVKFKIKNGKLIKDYVLFDNSFHKNKFYSPIILGNNIIDFNAVSLDKKSFKLIFKSISINDISKTKKVPIAFLQKYIGNDNKTTYVVDRETKIKTITPEKLLKIAKKSNYQEQGIRYFINNDGYVIYNSATQSIYYVDKTLKLKQIFELGVPNKKSYFYCYQDLKTKQLYLVNYEKPNKGSLYKLNLLNKNIEYLRSVNNYIYSIYNNKIIYTQKEKKYLNIMIDSVYSNNKKNTNSKIFIKEIIIN